jgi:hypothetical protein
MTELGFLQPSRVPKPTNTALKISGWIYQNRHLQKNSAVLSSWIGLTGLMKYFPNLGVIVANYNQF